MADGQDKVLTLSDAIETALANNAAVKEAQQHYLAAIESERSARCDFLPKLSASYSYTDLKDQPYMMFNGLRIPMSSEDVYQWNVTAVQPIFTGFALLSRYEMAKYGVDLQDTSRALAELDVVQQVREAYCRVLLSRKAYDVSDEALRNLESHVQDAERFYREGMIPYNDLLKSRVALAQAVQDRARAGADRDLALSVLNTVLRFDIDRGTRVQDIQELNQTVPDQARLTDEALCRRPELAALKIAIANADMAIRLVRSSYYPAVSLVGRYERSGDTPKADSNDYSNDHNAMLAIQAQWQFFEWGKTRSEASRYVHEKNALKEKMSLIEDKVRIDVKNSILDMEVAGRNILTAREALGQAKENYRLVDLQYRQQMTTSTEVLDARVYLSQAQMNYYGALYGYMISQARLDRAVGLIPARASTR
jgi:outer membrane protein TolC